MAVYQFGSLNTTALTVPGLYVEVVPPAGTLLNGVPTNVLGIVGTASWGPVNQPVIISGTQSYSQVFGTLQNRTFDMGTPVATAALQGANNFRCVRVTDGTDTAASNTVLTNCVTFTSKYTGSTGNNIVVAIANGAAANSYSLAVSMPGMLQEYYNNLTGTGAALWSNIANAVNNGQSTLRGPSQIISATAGGGSTAPTLTSYVLLGGTDGASGANASTLVGQDVNGSRQGMYALRGQGCSVGMLADVTAYTNWSTISAFGLSEAIYMIQNGPAGESITSATGNLAAAGVDSYSFKPMLGDWMYWLDPVNGLRLVGPQSFIAGLLSNLSPQNSTLNKVLYGISGTQKSGLPGSGIFQTYSQAELQALAAARLDVIANPCPGGSYYGSQFGHNSSSNLVVHGDNYTRMTNYISTTIAAGLGIYVGQVINTSLFQNITATINAFMAALLQQGLLARTSTGGLPYSVTCNTSNNPQTRTALGYVQCDVSAQYQGINEQFIVNIQGGSSVVVSSNVLPQ